MSFLRRPSATPQDKGAGGIRRPTLKFDGASTPQTVTSAIQVVSPTAKGASRKGSFAAIMAMTSGSSTTKEPTVAPAASEGGLSRTGSFVAMMQAASGSIGSTVQRVRARNDTQLHDADPAPGRSESVESEEPTWVDHEFPMKGSFATTDANRSLLADVEARAKIFFAKHDPEVAERPSQLGRIAAYAAVNGEYAVNAKLLRRYGAGLPIPKIAPRRPTLQPVPLSVPASVVAKEASPPPTPTESHVTHVPLKESIRSFYEKNDPILLRAKGTNLLEEDLKFVSTKGLALYEDKLQTTYGRGLRSVHLHGPSDEDADIGDRILVSKGSFAEVLETKTDEPPPWMESLELAASAKRADAVACADYCEMVPNKAFGVCACGFQLMDHDSAPSLLVPNNSQYSTFGKKL